MGKDEIRRTLLRLSHQILPRYKVQTFRGVSRGEGVRIKNLIRGKV